ncbi:MAG: cytidylate kinase-like family protein [Lachnospiraceae bacterium]|nr:cytidylate kinase-like family protein [Lachnospiraceae bacterium]
MDKVITISRQYGSGGREIGQKLAEAWNVPFYDNELISRAAKESGFAEATFEKAESRATNSLLYSIARGLTAFNGQETTFSNLSLDDRIYIAQANVIRKVASEGPCVIVGRCADYILRKLDNLVNVFVWADMPFRVERAIRIDNMSPDKIEEEIVKIDKRRGNYHNFHTGEKWGRAENYHLSIRSSMTGIDGAVEVIKLFVDKASLRGAKQGE